MFLACRSPSLSRRLNLIVIKISVYISVTLFLMTHKTRSVYGMFQTFPGSSRTLELHQCKCSLSLSTLSAIITTAADWSDCCHVKSDDCPQDMRPVPSTSLRWHSFVTEQEGTVQSSVLTTTFTHIDIINTISNHFLQDLMNF